MFFSEKNNNLKFNFSQAKLGLNNKIMLKSFDEKKGESTVVRDSI